MDDHLWVPFTVPGSGARIEVTAGRGATAVTTAGSEFLDFASGLWNLGWGYGDEELGLAIREQLDRLAYYPTFRDTRSDIAARLARALSEVAGQPEAQVVLGTGGGSAVEAALKIAALARGGRGMCVALQGSYHGTMYGGSGLSGQDIAQARTRAIFDWITHVPPNDCEAFRAVARKHELSCVVLEPVLGNGSLVLEKEFVDCVYEECRRQGALVVADEVATGFGRTGQLFVSDDWPEVPDLRLVSKLLTGGVLPLSAVLVQPQVWTRLRSDGLALPHGETQGGNPLACAAALVIVGRFARPEFRAHLAARAQVFESWVTERAWPAEAVSGLGFMQTVDLRQAEILPGASTEQRIVLLDSMLQSAGLRTYAGGNHMSLFPPLSVSDEELAEAGRILDETWKLLG